MISSQLPIPKLLVLVLLIKPTFQQQDLNARETCIKEQEFCFPPFLGDKDFKRVKIQKKLDGSQYRFALFSRQKKTWIGVAISKDEKTMIEGDKTWYCTSFDSNIRIATLEESGTLTDKGQVSPEMSQSHNEGSIDCFFDIEPSFVIVHESSNTSTTFNLDVDDVYIRLLWGTKEDVNAPLSKAVQETIKMKIKLSDYKAKAQVTEKPIDYTDEPDEVDQSDTTKKSSTKNKEPGNLLLVFLLALINLIFSNTDLKT